MLNLFQCKKAMRPDRCAPLVKVNSVMNINVPRGVVEPSMAPKLYNVKICQCVLQVLVYLFYSPTVIRKGGFRRGITWHITVNWCWISRRNTSTNTVIDSPNISGSAEGSQRSLDSISRTKMSGFVALTH